MNGREQSKLRFEYNDFLREYYSKLSHGRLAINQTKEKLYKPNLTGSVTIG